MNYYVRIFIVIQVGNSATNYQVTTLILMADFLFNIVPLCELNVNICPNYLLIMKV